MERITFDASAGEGAKIAAFIMPTNSPDPKGVIQICHGMADYFGRFRELAEHLNNGGWHVCGMDMMGHGDTYKENDGEKFPKGFFGSCDDSWMCILKDEMKLHSLVKERFGKTKYVLYGHSMGSFVCRNISVTPEWAKEFDKFIYASTMGPNPAVGAGIFLSRCSFIFGRKLMPGKLLDKIAFGTYNKRIPNPKTNYDWVSSDEEVIKEYCADPMAGFLFTNKGFYDLFKLVQRMQSSKAYANAPKKPVLLAYAEEDPVTGYGKGAQTVADKFKEAGSLVTVKNYGPYRHEIQNEPVRKIYFEDILNFCNS